MTTRRVRIRRLRAAAAAGIFVVSGPLVSGPEALAQADAASPIQHLIVVIGENHSFDKLYGTYTPGPGQSIDNLLSKGIVKADGSPGPNVALALQHTASDTVTYSLDPTLTGAYNPLPQPNTTSAIGQPPNVPDPRFPADLPNAPFQITKYTEYQNDYVGDPIHRFYQMQQQMAQGHNDLFVWNDQTEGRRIAQLHRPHVDREVHRAQLAAAGAVRPELGQPPEPEGLGSQPVRSHQRPSRGGPLRPLQLRQQRGKLEPSRARRDGARRDGRRLGPWPSTTSASTPASSRGRHSPCFPATRHGWA